jgi:hypothetical protein
MKTKLSKALCLYAVWIERATVALSVAVIIATAYLTGGLLP